MNKLRRRAAALTAALTTALTLGAPAPVAAAQDSFSYAFRVYLGGFPLGNLNVAGRGDGATYRAQGEFRVSSLLALAIDSDASAAVSGLLEAGRTLPQSFTYQLRDRKDSSDLTMGFDAAGNPVSVAVDPPKAKRNRDVQPSGAQGAIDPATAIYLLGAPRADPCAFAYEIYDGRKLHRSTLSGPAVASPEGGVICNGLYERVAGFREKDMTPERARHAFKARLTPMEGGGWRPERIWADTVWGQASVVRR